MRSFYAKELIAEPWPAAMLAMACAAIPLMGWGAFILIGLMTLCRGPKLGLWVAFCAAIPAIVKGAYTHQTDVLLANAIGGCFYTWLSATVFWYSRSWTLVLEATLIFAIIGLAMIHWLMPDITDWWIKNYQNLLQQFQTQVASLDEFNDGEMNQILTLIRDSGFLQILSRITTGVVFAFILVYNLVNLLVARLWQIVAFNSHARLSQELMNIRMGRLSLLGFILSIAAAYYHLMLAWDFIPIFVALFLCAGLSLLHFHTSRLKNGTILLVMVYALMICFPTYIIPVLLSAALLDSLVNIRQRT